MRTVAPLKNIVELVKAKEAQLKAVIERSKGVGTAPVITYKYDLTSIRALGTYQYVAGKFHTIRLNPALMNELGEKYINDVFVHEYAHACVQQYVINKNRFQKVMPHGYEFKMFCALFGIDGRATTSVASGAVALKTSTRTTKIHLYTCGCQDFHLSTQRHNKVLSGTASYKCKKCRKPLTKKK
jgi:SprT protein